jgi:serpin B
MVLVLAGATPMASADLNLLATGNTDFAFELYNQVKQNEGEDKNLFFSPLSISAALAMTYAGARGETEKQMAQSLHFSLPQQKLHSAFSGLLSDLESTTDYELALANRLWGQKDFDFSGDFQKLTETRYQGGFQLADFASDPEACRKAINLWVEEKTKRKIRDLLLFGDIKTLTRLVLTNAIYFKGRWAATFDPKKTSATPFTLQDGKTTVVAPMMTQTDRFHYAEDSLLQALELPYSGQRLSMLVLLPQKGVRLSQVEKALTSDNLTRWRSAMTPEEVQVYLPKFKTTLRFLLNQPLKALGIHDAFDEFKANFSGMTGRSNLFISKAIHKAFVDVNEEGTEAAAATAVVMDTKSLRRGFVFRANRPFVFMILDKKSGTILFLGRIMNPKQQSNS